jgi:hypothetical protein
MAVNKNFVVKHGLEVKTDLLYADAQLVRVGVGTTLAYHKLHVNGDLKVEDDLQVVGVTSLGTNTKIINGTLEAGNTGVGTYGQFLVATGAGIAWTTAPNLRKQEIFTALEGQKQFNFAHTIGFLDVFVNGVKLSTSEYTETAAFVTLLNGCSVDDTVELIGYYLYDNIGAANTTGIQGITVLEENAVTGTPAQVTSINFVGAHVTAAGTGAGVTVTFLGAGVGIASSGTQIGYGFTNINFIGAGNTFQVNGQSIDVSINSGGETFWSKDETYSTGIVTTGRVGIGSTLPITAEGLDTRGVVKTDSLFATKKTLDKDVETFAGYNMFAAGSLAIGAGNSITVIDDATLTILDVIETPVNATLGIFRNDVNVGYGITKLNFTGANNFVTQASANAIDVKIDSGVGIYSGGQPIAFGITALNFVGLANTFGVDGGQINISINSGSGGKFEDNVNGIHTTSRVGIGSTIPNTGAALDVDGIIKTHTFFANKAVVEQDVTTIAGYNMFGAGPITVADGKVINIIDESTLSVLDAYSVPSGTRWSRNSTGIHTSLNVGIGTTTCDGAADPNNTFILNAGIVTANYYYGDGRFLRNVGVAVSDVAPSSPEEGNMWWNSTLGRGFIYYGAASAWVDFAPGTGGGGGTITVTGGGSGGGFFSNEQTNSGIHTTALNVGVGTTNPRFQLEVGPVGAAGTSLWVNGNARVTGILTVGSSSIILDGTTNQIKIGSGTVIDENGFGSVTTLNVTGVTTLGIVTAGNIYSTGIITATSFSGNATSATTATYATTAGIATYSETTGIATYATTAGIATYATTAGIATYSETAGIATYASTAGVSTTATTAGYATTAGIATVAQGLTGTPNIEVGILTATSAVIGSGVTINAGGLNVTGVVTASTFIGTFPAGSLVGALPALDGSLLTGVVAAGTGVIVEDDGTPIGTAGTINFGANLTVSPVSAGVVTVTATGGGAGYFVETLVGIHTLSNVGVGTTNPTSALTVSGNIECSSTVTANSVSATSLSASSGNIIASSGNIYFSTTNKELGWTTGNGIIRTLGAGSSLSINGGNPGENMGVFTQGGSVELYHNNSKKFETIGTGITVTGTTFTNELNVSGVSTFADDVIFGGGTEINSAGELSLQNLSRIMLGFGSGTPNGLVIRQNSSSNVSEIVNVGGDDIQIQADSGRSVFIGNDNDTDALKINNTGILIAGVTTTTALQVGTGGTVINATATAKVGIATTNPVSTLQVERFGVQTGFGTFAAAAGITTFIDSFTISSTDFKTAEYTVHLQSASSIQAQKVLVMQNGSTAYSQEWAVMSHPDLLVSIGATVTGGAVRLNVTPETGVTGIITYRFTRNAML